MGWKPSFVDKRFTKLDDFGVVHVEHGRCPIGSNRIGRSRMSRASPTDRRWMKVARKLVERISVEEKNPAITKRLHAIILLRDPTSSLIRAHFQKQSGWPAKLAEQKERFFDKCVRAACC